MRRFKAERSFGTKSRKLVRPDEYKAKKRLIKTWHNPYTEKEEVEREKDWIKRESLFTYDRIWIGYERRQGGMDIREEVLLRDGPICVTACNRNGPGLQSARFQVFTHSFSLP